MSTQKKMTTPAKKPTKPTAKATAKKTAPKVVPKPARKRSSKPAPRKVLKQMTNDPTSHTNAVEALLSSIAAKLTELVQIETYLAQKLCEAPAVATPIAAPIAVPVQPALASVPAVPAVPAPAQQTAEPTAPATRPGQGTIGGLVWEYCDGLNTSLGRAPTKDELIATIKQYSPTFNGQPVNELTASTQYSKWRSAQGLPRLPRGYGANKPATVPTAEEAAAQNNAPLGYPRAAVGPSMPALPVALSPAAPVPVEAPLPAPFVPPVTPPAAPSGNLLPPWLRPQG